MIILIDGDILVYRFAYEGKKQEEQPLFSASETKTLEECYENVDKFMENLKAEVPSVGYIGYLSCKRKDTFRVPISQSREYKGNRKTEPPKYYTEIKQYFIEKYNFIQLKQIEADDALSIKGTELYPDCIICSTDKDLRQIKGNHYNPNTNDFFRTTDDGPSRLLLKQLVTGDSTDNIEGIRKRGPKAAEKIVHDNLDIELIPQVILNEYIAEYGLEEGMRRFSETYLLVYLLRENSFNEELGEVTYWNKNGRTTEQPEEGLFF
jgi:5'-3' exonuclease